MSEPTEPSPRVRRILAAVEREAQLLRHGPTEPLAPAEPLLAALEMAVAGATRDEVRAAIDVRDDVLHAVFGDGSPPRQRLERG